MTLKVGDLIPIGGGKKWASGNGYGGTPQVTINNLDFTPSKVIVHAYDGTTYKYVSVITNASDLGDSNAEAIRGFKNSSNVDCQYRTAEGQYDDYIIANGFKFYIGSNWNFKWWAYE